MFSITLLFGIGTMSVFLVTSLADTGDVPMITAPAELPSVSSEMPGSSLLHFGASPSADSDSAVSASPSAAFPSTSAASTTDEAESNTGTCHGPPGLKGASWFASGKWPGTLAQDQVSCNSNYNNVTRACCDEVKGEAQMGSECGLVVCKVSNLSESALTACFEKNEAKSGCEKPAEPSTTASKSPAASQSSNAVRLAASMALTLLASSVALGVSM